MTASLPMYWRPETAQKWRALWHHVQAAGQSEGLSLPDLTAPEDLPADWYDHWRDPDLIVSVTCGLPLRDGLRDQVTYIGSLEMGLGGPDGHYHSLIIVRAGDTAPRKRRRIAFNSADSQSGWGATQIDQPPHPELQDAVAHLETGAHAASLDAVIEGEADVACIDASTWRILDHFFPHKTAQIAILGQTRPIPGLPVITARHRDPAPLFRALRTGMAAFQTDTPMSMGGRVGIVRLNEGLYHDMAIPTPPQLPVVT